MGNWKFMKCNGDYTSMLVTVARTDIVNKSLSDAYRKNRVSQNFTINQESSATLTCNSTALGDLSVSKMYKTVDL